MLLNINPVEKLQMLVTFSSGCAASAFLIPTVMMCYWRRATAAGTIAAMLAGALAAFSLNMVGLVIAIALQDGLRAVQPAGLRADRVGAARFADRRHRRQPAHAAAG